MFEVDDLSGAYSKINPKAKVKKQVKSNRSPIVEKKHVIATPKQAPKTPKAQPQQAKKPLQIQDQAGEYTATDTLVVDKVGDEYWIIIKEDADRLTDHQLFAYMYRRFGLQAHQLDIVRPKKQS